MLPITTRANTPIVMPNMVKKALIFLRNTFLKILIAPPPVLRYVPSSCWSVAGLAESGGRRVFGRLTDRSCTWPDGEVSVMGFVLRQSLQ